MTNIDHIVFACTELSEGCAHIEEMFGVKPQFGGVHHGRGTHNALLGLGESTYLEIVAPDPSQAQNENLPWMPTTTYNHLSVIGWAAKSDNLERTISLAENSQTCLGQVESGSRELPDGEILTWNLSLPRLGTERGVIPFFVDWGHSIHPATRIPQAGKIVQLEISHPLPAKLNDHLSGLQTPVACKLGRTRIHVRIELLNGKEIVLS